MGRVSVRIQEFWTIPRKGITMVTLVVMILSIVSMVVGVVGLMGTWTEGVGRKTWGKGRWKIIKERGNVMKKMVTLLVVGLGIRVRVMVMKILGYKVVYLQGKMDGCYNYNYMTFRRCHVMIRKNNENVFILNPSFNERVLWKFGEGDYTWFMKYDKVMVEVCDLIVSHSLLTPYKSSGSKTERGWGEDKGVSFYMLDDTYTLPTHKGNWNTGIREVEEKVDWKIFNDYNEEEDIKFNGVTPKSGIGIRKYINLTLGYNDRNDGFTRTYFSRSKWNFSRNRKMTPSKMKGFRDRKDKMYILSNERGSVSMEGLGMLLDLLVKVVGFVFIWVNIPQIVKTVKTKNVEGLSKSMWFILTFGYGVYSLKSIVDKNYSILIGLMGCFVGCGIMSILIVKYSKKKEKIKKKERKTVMNNQSGKVSIGLLLGIVWYVGWMIFIGLKSTQLNGVLGERITILFEVYLILSGMLFVNSCIHYKRQKEYNKGMVDYWTGKRKWEPIKKGFNEFTIPCWIKTFKMWLDDLGDRGEVILPIGKENEMEELLGLLKKFINWLFGKKVDVCFDCGKKGTVYKVTSRMGVSCNLCVECINWLKDGGSMIHVG